MSQLSHPYIISERSCRYLSTGSNRQRSGNVTVLSQMFKAGSPGCLAVVFPSHVRRHP